ncbi:putative FAD synthase [Triplophysa rosa]|uniref:FAD synthase n=1 Tax=Triplophysa rosa TaxID=992332 RepID=A0A9W7WAM6_TRIRA|nr:putative FAD synthase [Triplophysa rosa]
MVRRCAFPGCPNREKLTRKRKSALPMSKDERLTFHVFPTHDSERLKLWLLTIRRDVNFPIRYVKQMKLCSEHFSPDDFRPCQGTLRRLKRTAVPNQCLHNAQETSNAPTQLSQESEGSTQDPKSADPFQPNQDPCPADSPPTSQSTQATDLSFSPAYLADVCSRHFGDDCFTNKAQFDAAGFADCLKLKDGSVPAIRDPEHGPRAITDRSCLLTLRISPGGKKRTRTPEGTRAERERDTCHAKTRIDIGGAFPLWRKVGEQMGFKSDPEMAFFLLQRVCGENVLVPRRRKSTHVPAPQTEESEGDSTHPSDEDEDMEASEICYEVSPSHPKEEPVETELDNRLEVSTGPVATADHTKIDHNYLDSSLGSLTPAAVQARTRPSKRCSVQVLGSDCGCAL